MAYGFCLGRGGKYAVEFLGPWYGTLVRDEFSGYKSVVKLHERKAAGCLAHARRKFDELIKDNQSPVALQAVQRIAWIYRIEREVQSLTIDERLAQRTSYRPKSAIRDVDQLTTMPSKQSIMGDKYTLPAGIWNSVMSVSHFSFGALALKSRFRTFSGAGLISPM